MHAPVVEVAWVAQRTESLPLLTRQLGECGAHAVLPLKHRQEAVLEEVEMPEGDEQRAEVPREALPDVR